MRLSWIQRSVLLFSFFCGLLVFGSQTPAQAVFNLSVTPQRGVQSISFEQAAPGDYLHNEEVTLSVTTTEAAQYNIYQTIYQPLTNDMGDTIPQEAFIVFSPSNSLGTLRTQLETPVPMGQSPVYTSNSAGDSDSFVLVYTVKVPETQPGGVYRTRITYTAQPTQQGDFSQSIQNLDVVVEIRPTFRVTVQSVKGSRELDLGHVSKSRPQAEETLKITIESNAGAFRISQQMTEPLVSQEGVVLDEKDFEFIASGGEKGELGGKGSIVPVPISVQPLYSSSSGAGDILLLQYLISPEVSQKAGVYRGAIDFKVESQSSSFPSQLIQIPVKVEIDTIFYLDVEMDQPGRVQFGMLKTKDDKRQKKAVLKVYSNLGLPYQVTQIVSNQLVNEKGQAVPNEYFTYFGSEAQTGTIANLSSVPVKEGESVVFTSDARGTAETFSLEYELALPQNPKPGNYNSRVKYSLTSL